MFIWIAQSASGLGNTFSIFIMSWILYDITGSKVAMGTLWFIFMISSIFSHLICGSFIDRVERKKAMIFSEWVRAAVFLIPTVLLPVGYLTVEILFGIAVIIGLVEPLFRPSSMAYIAAIVPKERLIKANSILETTTQTMMLIGPALGGLLVSLISPLAVLALLIFTLGLSGFVLLFLPNEKGFNSNNKAQSWIKELTEGLQFYKTNKLFLWIGLLLLVVNFSAGAAQPMLLPYVVEHLKGTSFQYGLMSSGIACGMVLGSLLLASRNELKRLKNIMLGSIVLAGISLGLLGIANTFLLAVLFITFNGFFVVIFNINNTILYQKNVPSHIRGRVFIARDLLSMLGIPIGAMSGGLIAEVIGLKSLFIILGLFMIVPCLIAWFLPSFQRLNQEHEIAGIKKSSTQQEQLVDI